MEPEYNLKDAFCPMAMVEVPQGPQDQAIGKEQYRLDLRQGCGARSGTPGSDRPYSDTPQASLLSG